MSDARYTALLVARGNDDEFRREDVAQSKDNSTAYSSGRKKPACSTCGETTHTAYFLYFATTPSNFRTSSIRVLVASILEVLGV